MKRPLPRVTLGSDDQTRRCKRLFTINNPTKSLWHQVCFATISCLSQYIPSHPTNAVKSKMPPYGTPQGPGMRSLSNIDPDRAQALARRPGGGLGGKGVLKTSGNGPSALERSGAGGRGLGKTSSKKPLKRSKRFGFRYFNETGWLILHYRRMPKDMIQGVSKFN